MSPRLRSSKILMASLYNPYSRLTPQARPSPYASPCMTHPASSSSSSRQMANPGSSQNTRVQIYIESMENDTHEREVESALVFKGILWPCENMGVKETQIEDTHTAVSRNAA